MAKIPTQGSIGKPRGSHPGIGALRRRPAEGERERRRLHDVLDMLPLYVILLAPDHRVPFANRFFEERFGKSEGRRCYEYLLGGSAPCEDCETFKVLRTNLSHHWEWTGPDGRDYDIHDFPFRDVDGSPLVLEMGIDITEREHTEAALGESSERLERRMAERMGELCRANQQLEEVDRRKNAFLAELSHELRNPLMPISNSLYVLKHAPPGGEQAGKARDVIDRQLGQLSRLVNDLLDITRMSRDKIHLQREPADLRDIVRRSADDQRSLFGARGVGLDVTLPALPVMVDVDATRIAQVVGNLLQNAAKFTWRGGRTLAALTQDQASKQATLRVLDSGVGMAPETLATLFQPFVQAERTLDRSKGGLGLGLALVKGLVELHGGEVSARSEGLGKGSEFIVRLPLAGATGAKPRFAPSIVRPARPRRVLVIEDNHDAADSLREAIELDGHEVRVAYDGSEGIALALAFLPEVVLCDIGLPGVDGYQVARALRAASALEDTLLVALSGYALPEDLQRAIDAGFARHFAKPPDLEVLKDLLASTPCEVSDSESITAPIPINPAD